MTKSVDKNDERQGDEEEQLCQSYVCKGPTRGPQSPVITLMSIFLPEHNQIPVLRLLGRKECVFDRSSISRSIGGLFHRNRDSNAYFICSPGLG